MIKMRQLFPVTGNQSQCSIFFMSMHNRNIRYISSYISKQRWTKMVRFNKLNFSTVVSSGISNLIPLKSILQIRDTFIVLPTGYGKSRIYFHLPELFEMITGEKSCIPIIYIAIASVDVLAISCAPLPFSILPLRPSAVFMSYMNPKRVRCPPVTLSQNLSNYFLIKCVQVLMRGRCNAFNNNHLLSAN